MKFDRRTRHYRQSKQFWYAATGLLLAAAVIWAVTLARTPKVQPQAPTESLKPFIPKDSHEWTQEELDNLNCEINKSLCPMATPKPRKWKYLDFKHTQHYQEVIEGLQARFTNWQPVAEIIARESGFQPHAKNKNSTAYGLGQLIKANQKVDCGVNIDCQLDLTKTYIVNRYGSTSRALSFHDKNNWY